MKAFRLLLIVAMVMVSVGFAFTPAKAGAFAAYASSIKLQNLQNTNSSISLIFYRTDGTIETTVSDTLAPNIGKDYWPLPAGVGTGFNGSVVVTSTTEVASISNILGNNGAAAGAYVADSSGANTVVLPVLMKNNGVFSSWFNVQNAGTGDANITVTYTDGTNAVYNGLKPGAARTFDNKDETHTGAIFAGTVTSTQPVVVTVILESNKIIFAHNGFKSPSPFPVMPTINVQPAKSIQTGVNLANASATSTNVTVTYTPNPGAGNGTACTETQTVPGNSYKTFALFAFAPGANPPGVTSTCAKGQKFVGSARVTANSAGVNLAIVVSQLTGSINGSAYNAFDPAAATGTFVVPLVMDRNSASLKLFTTINIINVSNVASTVTCNYAGGYSQTSASMSQWESTIIFNNNAIAPNYVGSAVCTANTAGAKFVAIVNEAAEVYSTNDLVLTYEAINRP